MGSHRVEHDWSDLAAVAAATLRLSVKQRNNVAFIFTTILLTYWIESLIEKKECMSG